MKKRMHAAYNLTTGEVLERTSSKVLNDNVKLTNYLDHKYFQTQLKNVWVFAHGENAIEKVCKKASAILNK